MAKDTRLYARFDIGMDENAKIARLSDAAFRALIEATFYSRRQLTDGFLDEFIAQKRWGREVLAELTSNHHERPSLVPVAGGYQIRDYGDHQTTSADIEAKRVAGRAGGRAKASRTVAPASEVLEQKASTTLAKTETETETETTTSNEVVKTNRSRGSRLSPDWLPSSESVAKIKTECPTVNPQNEHAAFIDYWIAQPGSKGVKLDWDATWRNWMRRKQTDHKGKPTPTERAKATLQLATDIDMRELTA